MKAGWRPIDPMSTSFFSSSSNDSKLDTAIYLSIFSFNYLQGFSLFLPIVAEPEPAFLASAGAEKITKIRLRLHYKGRRIK